MALDRKVLAKRFKKFPGDTGEIDWEKRERLFEKFPDGIAEIVAIWDKKEPGVEQPSLQDYQKPRASSTPSIPVYLRSGGTHPVTGQPNIIARSMDVSIWPISGRTDQAGILTKYYGAAKLLEILADPDMGWGRIYKLKPVPVEQLDAERKSLMQPESRREFERLQKGGQLLQNASEAAVQKLSVGEKMVSLGALTKAEMDSALNEKDLDPYSQLTDEEMASIDDIPVTNEEAVETL